MRVLLADDQPQVRSALRLLLEQESKIHIIDEVTNARDLLLQTQRICPDLILLDWELPGLSDINILSILQECRPYLSIIALSVDLEAHELAITAGVDAFVSKGEPPEKLLAVVRTLKDGGTNKMKMEMVKDWMTQDIITVSPDMTLAEAHRLMTDQQVRRLPVMLAGKLVGIVTLGDVREAEPSDATSLSIWEINYLLAELKLERIMTRNPITISHAATLGKAAQIMLENKVSGLPVVDENGKVVGIITESDIFRAVAKTWDMVENVPV